MRIAFIFDALLYGGIERVGINYLNLLNTGGNEVDVFILNTKRIEGIIDEIPSNMKIYKTFINKYMCPNTYWYIAKRWWWGKALFPIIHAFLYIFIRIYGVRFLKYGRYDLAISMAGHTSDLTINAYNIIRSDKKIAWLHGALYEYMIINPGYERMYRRIKNIVTLNDFYEKNCFFFNKYMKFNSIKLYNPCFIEERKLNQAKIADIKSKYGDFVLMISRMISPKNPKGLINAMVHIYNEYEKKYNVVFVGDGELFDEFKAYAKNTPIADHIFFIGNDPQPQNYYAAAKMFGFSSYSEGLPTVIVEAMFFGLPIATSDTSVRGILQDGKYGLISPIDDAQALGDDIYKLMSDDEEYDKYSALSKERFNSSRPEVIREKLFNYITTLW